MLGDAPSPNDDSVGEPYSGDSGSMLYDIMEAAGVSELDWVATNLVACHTDVGQGFRPPKRSEILACWPRLLQVFQMYQPRVIVTFGVTVKKTMDWVRDDIQFNGKKPLWIEGTHPAMILKAGGVASVSFSYTVTAIKSALSKIEWEDRLNGSV